MKKSGRKALLRVAIIFIIFIVYVFWDNNRIIVEEQEVDIDQLPAKLQGFRILQISDLHEKQFGSNQNRLIELINDLDYDAIVFTGDMMDDRENTDYHSFYSLIEGIDDKENAWFVPGNTDPDSYIIDKVVEKSEFILGMEERGVHLLETMETVSMDGAKVHFVNFELSIIENPEYIDQVEGIVSMDYQNDEQYLAYQAELWETLPMFDEIEETDVVVALNHYPISDSRITHIQQNDKLEWRNFDLILAGHYHGGQIRLPFIGALFVPEPWHEPNSIFPPQDRVKGLWEYAGVKQYVSTGLGSSNAISFLGFRLFNRPEINLLILKR